MTSRSDNRDRDPTLDALSELPRLQASPGFTRQLLLRLDERQVAGWSRSFPWTWGAAAALLILTIGASISWEEARQRRELRGQIRTIDAERRALAADLQRLQSGTVVYLGSDDRTDYLIDLEGRATTSATSDRRMIVPASQIY